MNYQKMEVSFPRKFLLDVAKKLGAVANEGGINRIHASIGGNGATSFVHFYLDGNGRKISTGAEIVGKKLNAKAAGAADKKLYWRAVDAKYVEAAAIHQVGFLRKNDKDWMTGHVFPLALNMHDDKRGVLTYEIMHDEQYHAASMGYTVMVTSRKNNVEKAGPIIRSLNKRVPVYQTGPLAANIANKIDDAPEKPHPVKDVITALAKAMKDHASGVLLAGKMSGTQIAHIQDTLDDVLFSEVYDILDAYVEDYKTPKAAK